MFRPFVEAGLFIEDHEGFFLVLFTVGLAIATGGLWLETRGLARGAEHSASIAERALTQLERPHLRVEVAANTFDSFWSELGKAQGGATVGVTGVIEIAFRNYGKYPEFARECHFSVAHSIEPPAGPGTPTSLEGDPIISPDGRTVVLTGKLSGNLPAGKTSEMKSGQRRIWFYGDLSYGNVIGIGDNFTTSFLWVYNGTTNTWSPSGDGGPERNRCT